MGKEWEERRGRDENHTREVGRRGKRTGDRELNQYSFQRGCYCPGLVSGSPTSQVRDLRQVTNTPRISAASLGKMGEPPLPPRVCVRNKDNANMKSKLNGTPEALNKCRFGF